MRPARPWNRVRGPVTLASALGMLLASSGFASIATPARAATAGLHRRGLPGSASGALPRTRVVRRAANPLSAVTVARGVTVQALTPSPALAGRKVEEFDLSPLGSLVVRIGGALYDFAGGERLTPRGVPVRSFAFVEGALAVITDRGTLAFWTQGGLREAGAAPRGARRLRSSESGHQLLLVGDPPRSGVIVYAVGSGLRPICGAPAPILAAAVEGEQQMVAIGNALFAVPEPGALSLRLALPDRHERILGLALAGNAVYFATPRAVSVLQGGVAIPLVLGIGGPLRMTGRGLVTLDTTAGRLFRIAGPGMTADHRVPPKRGPSRAAGSLQIRFANADAEHCAPSCALYVDGRIVHPQEDTKAGQWPKSLRLRAPAGRHRVEAALTWPQSREDVSFPFTFRGAEIDVRAGKAGSVTLDAGRVWNFSDVGMAYPASGPTAEWFDQLVEAMRAAQRGAPEDPVVAALAAARQRARGAARPVRRVRLDLPEEFGGSREYDAGQVRLLVDWLKRRHWAWFAPLPEAFVARMPESMRVEYQLLGDQVEREKSFLGQLGELANCMGP